MHRSRIAASLRQLIADRRISPATLQVSTAMTPERLAAMTVPAGTGAPAGATNADQPLTRKDIALMSGLAVHLERGLDMDDDERLQAVLGSLTVEWKLSIENLVDLTGMPALDIQIALADPAALPTETKYGLAVRISYLISAVTRSRTRAG